jgi:hypothetical protein
MVFQGCQLEVGHHPEEGSTVLLLRADTSQAGASSGASVGFATQGPGFTLCTDVQVASREHPSFSGIVLGSWNVFIDIAPTQTALHRALDL